MKHRTIFNKIIPVIVLFAFAKAGIAQTNNLDSVKTNNLAEKYIGFAKQMESTISSAISTIKGADFRKGFTNNVMHFMEGYQG
jgi:hypothetical protein